jgi:hypothetical protein
MTIQSPVTSLKYDYVKQEFEDVGESLNKDLSHIKMSLTRDVHTESFDIEICIYGQDTGDSEPIVQCTFSGESVVFNVERLRTDGAVAPYEVLSLFDQKLLDIFILNGLKIHWNDGDVTHKMINPTPRMNVGLLFAQDR